jgi:hypothetical protein
MTLSELLNAIPFDYHDRDVQRRSVAALKLVEAFQAAEQALNVALIDDTADAEFVRAWDAVATAYAQLLEVDLG